MQNLLFSSVGQTNVDNAAAVNAFYGPDTANRNVLTGLTPQERFIQVLYLDVLGRAGAMSEIDGWLPVLSGPGGQAAVAAGIEQSPEAMMRLVNTWYETYLGRAADSGGLSYWSGLLQTQSEEQVLSQILSSTEFFNRAQMLVSGGTVNQRYVQALYGVLLDRNGSATEIAGWVNDLPTLGNAGVVLGFLTSAEFRTNQFGAYYQALLHRPADSAGLSGWVTSGSELARCPRRIRVQFGILQQRLTQRTTKGDYFSRDKEKPANPGWVLPAFSGY